MKQKVLFFAAPVTEESPLHGHEELRQMAIQYVELYGEGCLKDPETPAFVRQALSQAAKLGIPRAS